MEIWLVTVNPYGIIPKRLHTIININNVKTKGTNFLPLLPTFWFKASVIRL
jgi:hypothetical protein